MKGIFVGLEGIDASGKTTISRMLEEKLRDMDINAKMVTKKFTQYDNVNLSNFSKSLKSLIWDYEGDMLKSISSQGWLYMHAIWYTTLTENFIKPKLNEYDVLIVDGWFYKIYSRFMLKKEFDKNLLDTVFNSILRCDKVFMLDALPQICWSRRDSFNPTEMGGFDFEIEDPKSSFIRYQNNVRDELLSISQKENWEVINSNSFTKEELTNNIAERIKVLVRR